MPEGSTEGLERFAIPGVGGIIERIVDGEKSILVQERHKAGAKAEEGMIEIPAGKIREGESIFDCLRREIGEETGLIVSRIEGEPESVSTTINGYRVLSYTPFSSAQNLAAGYPIMVQVFFCRVGAEARLLKQSDESRNLRWVGIDELRALLEAPSRLYPMHIETLRRYCELELVRRAR
ncbi:MAG TPA: NUDIX domain-containing protein [Rectinemataceae bacterium]|nr:NUDIX domain-containing protein [Rectinemataceae bacterium]